MSLETKGFEKFTGGGHSEGPYITISKGGLITFSIVALRTFNIKQYRFGEFFFNPQTSEIAIKLHMEPIPDGYKMSSPNSGNSFFTAKKVITHYHIYHTETKRYPFKWDEKTSTVIVKVKMAGDTP